MSEQAPEAPARTSSSSRENVFTRRIGPLPMWQWLLIGGGLIGVYVIYQYRKNAATANAASNTAAGTSTGGTTSASQVPQFVNQTYTYVAPPVVQPPPPSGHARPAPAPQPVQRAPVPAPAATLQYVPGGYPGGIGAGAGAQTTGTAYNYSASQIQQLGFPNLNGLTLAQAKQALSGYAGGKFSISNVSGNAAGKIVSFTPYSTGQVNVGLN